ncbi:MAG: TonB-dependent receptor [Proteobacteria bacterium]|nr:TonB-dependent receptor [Pseudomonadota bacterium]
MKPNKLRQQIHLVTVGLLAAATLPLSVQTSAQNAEQIEQIIVTGSRISRDSNLAGALPVQSISAEDIRMSGEFSISDVINDIPALLSSVTSEQSIDAAFADGANVLNLRGMGSSRTLVLVNGRRHVGGLQGRSSVDIGSIPMPLVERVEVLTGGASAVYGADAVTGVVNFILKDDFEGFEIDVNYGLSEYGDGEQTAVSVVFGENFAGGRGNFTVALDIRQDDGLQVVDRVRGHLAGSSRDWVNPALRFQQGDIGSSTPNFAQYFNFANTGLTNFGLPIPTSDDFIADYTAEFGSAPSLTAAETALINQAANAPQRAVLPGRTFPFTSGYGYLIPGNPFTFDGFDPEVDIDLNGNGVPDCLDSWTGYNSVFGAASFGVLGGCWNIAEDGSYAVVQDGLVAGTFQGFGGDSYNTIQNNRGDILLPDEKFTVNLLTHYDLSDSMTVFGEFKYVTQETETDARPGSFWDLLFGAADNPYIPAFLQEVADATGGIAITVDPIFFNRVRKTERDTYRLVVGLEGTLDNGWTYEFSANYGRFEQEITRNGGVINDRFFAALDAVTDPATGQPACRSEVDPSAPALNTPFEIPAYDAGYFSFTPGAGQCVPLNIWAGQPGITDAATAFVTTKQWDRLKMEQTVFTASLVGDSADFFELPGGPIGFAVGIEYREEESNARFDPWQRGVIPAGAPFAAGSLISDHSENSSLTFRPQLSTKNERGKYDTTDVYLELSLPLLSGVRFAEELTFDVAARQSDYSTIGNSTSWKTNLIWAPINDFAIRGGVSQAVRAPNITELFGPEIGTSFRPADPCDAAQITAIAADNPGLAANYQANCVAAFQAFGLDPFDSNGVYSFADPLSASFGGVSGGNRNLTEETADTVTYGFVFQPSFLEGFSLTVDYWEIEIEDAISSVTSQNIVDGCYQGAVPNTGFCNLFTRNSDPASAQYGGFNFLRSTDINFASLKSSGVDLSASYNFSRGVHDFGIAVQATFVEEIDFFTNPADPSEVNPELGEVNRPELAGNIYLTWDWGDLTVAWQSQYLDDMLVSFVEIETARTLYGDAVFMKETWIHDLSARYTYSDQITIYAGIKNLTQEDPFDTDRAFPASPRGRMLFLGGSYRL